MAAFSPRSFVLVLGFAFLATSQREALAQRRRAEPPKRTMNAVEEFRQRKALEKQKLRKEYQAKTDNKTTVTVEVLTGDDSAGVRAEAWRPIFEDLGYAFIMRRGTSRDKVDVREEKLGRLREVKAIGRLDAKGRLVFPDRSFSSQDGPKLIEWLRELEAYGAQGSPEGKPLFGLTEPQYKEVFEGLSQKVEKEPQGLELNDALQRLELPAAYPLRMTTSATEWLKSTFQSVPTVRQRMKGMTKGSALAILLNEYGMGYRPLRTPAGSIEIVVDPLTKTTDVWPIGWTPKQALRDAAPKLYELKPIEIEDKKLTEALESIAAETGVPIFIDHFGIRVQGVDLNAIRASQRMRQTAMSLVLSRLTVPHHLVSEVRIDELGQPFVWIKVLVPGSPNP